jgi:hypothetical protein
VLGLTPGAQAKIQGAAKDSAGFTYSPLQPRIKTLPQEVG